MSRPRPGPFPIAPILEDLGAENVPRVRGSGHKKMRCPFHPDKTPSASVSEYGFNCFTCGVTGDAVKLMRTQGGERTYADAVRRCEEIAGGTGRAVPPASSWSGDLLA